MAKHEAEYSCDGCGKFVESGSDVRGSVSVYSSHGSFLLCDVCDDCASRIEGILIAKLAEPNPLIHEHTPSLPEARPKCLDCNDTRIVMVENSPDDVYTKLCHCAVSTETPA
jgi:hypothetical protein